MTSGKIAGVPVDISRTGYTGDLGYEIWVPWNDAMRESLGRAHGRRASSSISMPPECWRWTWRASKPGCC